MTPEEKLLLDIFGDEAARESAETYSVTDIRRAFADHASNDDWGVPSFYEGSLLAALRGELEPVLAFDRFADCGAKVEHEVSLCPPCREKFNAWRERRKGDGGGNA